MDAKEARNLAINSNLAIMWPEYKEIKEKINESAHLGKFMYIHTLLNSILSELTIVKLRSEGFLLEAKETGNNKYSWIIKW